MTRELVQLPPPFKLRGVQPAFGSQVGNPGVEQLPPNTVRPPMVSEREVCNPLQVGDELIRRVEAQLLDAERMQPWEAGLAVDTSNNVDILQIDAGLPYNSLVISCLTKQITERFFLAVSFGELGASNRIARQGRDALPSQFLCGNFQIYPTFDTYAFGCGAWNFGTTQAPLVIVPVFLSTPAAARSVMVKVTQSLIAG